MRAIWHLEVIVSRLKYLCAPYKPLQLRHPFRFGIAWPSTWVVLHGHQLTLVDNSSRTPYKVPKIMCFVQSCVLLDELVEAGRRCRTCRKVLGIDLLQYPDQHIIAEIQKLSHCVKSQCNKWRQVRSTVCRG